MKRMNVVVCVVFTIAVSREIPYAESDSILFIPFFVSNMKNVVSYLFGWRVRFPVQ